MLQSLTKPLYDKPCSTENKFSPQSTFPSPLGLQVPKMATHTYSAVDMLGVREQRRYGGSSEILHKKLHARVSKDQDLGDVLRLKPSPHIREASKQSRSSRSHQSTEAIDARRSAARQLDGTEAEWMYRGRTESEHAESQPIPAPSGVDKQHKEGFQRFYKAVVSPTHVRVTAGGRIVPNTRGPVSPASRQLGDRLMSDAASVSRSAHSTEPPPPPYGYPMAPSGFAPMPGMYPPWMPPMLPGLHHVSGPYPVMPWQVLPPGYPVPSHANLHAAASEPPEHPRGSRRSDAGSTKAASVGPTPEKSQQRRMAFPPPGWMVPPGQPCMPYPPAGYPWGAMPGQSIAPGREHEKAARASISSSTQHIQDMKSASNAHRGAQTPPISSIKPSDITKKQIDVLRQNLKYQEDQLQYNRHQIDENSMEKRIEVIKQQIQHFEKNLETQLKFESSHYPKDKNLLSRSEPARAVSGSKASVVSEDMSEAGPYKLKNTSSTSLARSVRSRASKEKKSAFGSGINSTKSVSAFTPLKHPFREDSVEEPAKGFGGIPAAAALAPPFEPHRSDRFAEPRPASITAPRPTVIKPEHVLSAPKDQPQADRDADRPYLVGFLPQDVNPTRALDTDYSYTRPLTEDELRARHMYWGKTPRHLQKGLPKFDGKDFYPPSPTKERSANRDTSSTRSLRRVPAGNSSLDYGFVKEPSESELFRSLEHAAPKTTREPFGIVTQSESLIKSECETDEISLNAASDRCLASCAVPDVDENTEPGKVSKPAKDVDSSDEGEDDKNLLFKGRNPGRQTSTKAQNEIWRSMLKKGKSSGNAVPGAVSSTTVQGILPQYAGHATASLTPAIANSTTPPRASLTKPAEGDSTFSLAIHDRKRENLPPALGK